MDPTVKGYAPLCSPPAPCRCIGPTTGFPDRPGLSREEGLVATFDDRSFNVLGITYTLRDEAGNVLSDLKWSPGPGGGSWSRMADRVYLGRDEQVRVDYAGGGRTACLAPF